MKTIRVTDREAREIFFNRYESAGRFYQKPFFWLVALLAVGLATVYFPGITDTTRYIILGGLVVPLGASFYMQTCEARNYAKKELAKLSGDKENITVKD